MDRHLTFHKYQQKPGGDGITSSKRWRRAESCLESYRLLSCHLRVGKVKEDILGTGVVVYEGGVCGRRSFHSVRADSEMKAFTGGIIQHPKLPYVSDGTSPGQI